MNEDHWGAPIMLRFGPEGQREIVVHSPEDARRLLSHVEWPARAGALSTAAQRELTACSCGFGNARLAREAFLRAAHGASLDILQ